MLVEEGASKVNMFDDSPSPALLQWLSGGQFASRWLRSLRLWWLLNQIYGVESHWATALPQPFRYGALRDRLFAPSHGTDETRSASDLSAGCRGTECVCQRSLRHFLINSSLSQSLTAWVQDTAQRTGLAIATIEASLDRAPFAVTHRSLRADLALLATQGWLKPVSRKGYACLPQEQLPLPPLETLPSSNFAALSPGQTWELLHLLESVAFVQPNLEVVIQTLWEQMTQSSRPAWKPVPPPPRRIFLHIDYILSPETQEVVDELQQQLESLWQTPDGGVIQFETWVARQQRLARVTVYPVCLHYVRRAKYLSAYGVDPDGQIGWHNYRLDRIRSAQVRILPWGDPQVPAVLRQQRATGTLPTPDWIERQLDAAWGFNFYLPQAWLVLRFPASFAENYVDETVRHPTFRRIAYADLLQAMEHQITDGQEQQRIRRLLEARSPQDAYYQAWVRVGDINVTMRLRDWRPQGEVMAPLSLREQMQAEVEMERSHYLDISLESV